MHRNLRFQWKPTPTILTFWFCTHILYILFWPIHICEWAFSRVNYRSDTTVNRHKLKLFVNNTAKLSNACPNLCFPRHPQLGILTPNFPFPTPKCVKLVFLILVNKGSKGLYLENSAYIWNILAIFYLKNNIRCNSPRKKVSRKNVNKQWRRLFYSLPFVRKMHIFPLCEQGSIQNRICLQWRKFVA